MSGPSPSNCLSNGDVTKDFSASANVSPVIYDERMSVHHINIVEATEYYCNSNFIRNIFCSSFSNLIQ